MLSTRASSCRVPLGGFVPVAEQAGHGAHRPTFSLLPLSHHAQRRTHALASECLGACGKVGVKQPRQAGYEIIVAVLHAPLEAQGRVSHAAGQRERVAVDAQTGVAVAIDPQPEMLGDADARQRVRVEPSLPHVCRSVSMQDAGWSRSDSSPCPPLRWTRIFRGGRLRFRRLPLPGRPRWRPRRLPPEQCVGM